MRNSTSTDNELVNALSLYLSSITNLTTPLSASTTFNLGEIDNLAGSLTAPNLTANSSTSIIFSLPPKQNQEDNSIVLGGSFKRDQGGRIVDTVNQGAIIGTNISVAAVFAVNSVLNVTSMRMIIISDSTAYANIDNFTNRTVASSIASAKLRRNNETISGPLTLNLYFQVLPNLNPQVDADFLCAFFDTTSSRWNDSGCSKPTYNAPYARHECVCNHLSSFALVWLPKTPRDPSVAAGTPVELKAVDIASLVFQSLSIACFLGVVIHGIVMRVTQPANFTSPRNLFPLLSCAVTMVLFIFYIALSMTVYTRYHNPPTNGTGRGRILASRANPETTTRSSSSDDLCLPHENSLAFFTYFLIILMFCIKTGSGYLNYEHFVRLFPPPRSRQLITMFSISFLISAFLVSLAAGLQSNPSNKITNIVEGKICWFTPGVIHYFLTIPTSLFLAANIFMFVLVARRMIRYARNAPNPSEHAQYVRRKRCVILILSSCVTQGLGWLFGLLIVAGGPASADVVGWFFNIFNGLEGLWSIILYILIRREGLDEDRISRPPRRPSTTKLDREYDSPSMRRSDRRTESRDEREFHNIDRRDTDAMNGPYADMAEMTTISRNDTYHYDRDDNRQTELM